MIMHLAPVQQVEIEGYTNLCVSNAKQRCWVLHHVVPICNTTDFIPMPYKLISVYDRVEEFPIRV
jgi:hypothetical protein